LWIALDWPLTANDLAAIDWAILKGAAAGDRYVAAQLAHRGEQG
jgi:hypothetical protein